MSVSLETLACEDFVVRAIRALDARDYEAVALGFAKDGVWHRGGEQLAGPDAVRTALGKRATDLETQHLIANLVVDFDPSQMAMVRYTLFAYAQTSDAPYHLHAIFKAEDHLVRTDEGWRFSRRAVEPAFKTLAAKAPA